ncbi:MAG: SDR family oxidoreductase [SAR202 cluster bacterium]|nr:SDR family oxidoreductase [SAR202 cluster bacterium]
MDLGLKGKTAIVTGGSQGIGKATALALAREGVNVAICARGEGPLRQAAREIADATGVNTVPIRADVTNPSDIQALVADAVRDLGGIDILVSNAVNSVPGGVLTLKDSDWMNHISVKLMAFVRLAREVTPHMKKRGGGRIVVIGGMAARGVSATNASNAVTNAGVAATAKNLAEEVAKDGILVNCIHPGTTRTPRNVQLAQDRARLLNITVEEVRRQSLQSIPIGRMVEPEDIASLAVFLASNKAGAITGQSIAVDGGAGRGIYY